MKRIIKIIVKEFPQFCIFLLKSILCILKYGGGKFSYRKRGGKVAVLANGPSLKEALAQRASDPNFQNSDFVVLNFFAFDPVFKELQPRYYCLADPMFFKKNHRYEEVSRFFDILQNEVFWDMNICIPSHQYKAFLKFANITNPHIRIVRCNATSYSGFPKFRNWSYKKGLAMPNPQTVANLAIYVALNAGYDEINLYGVDHTFFDSLCVDDDNRLCSRVGHFYEKESRLKPLINDVDKVWKISDYILAIGQMFKSHDLLANYARYLGANILNCTPGSMIDSYLRKKSN